jgi:hypothetical protein
MTSYYHDEVVEFSLLISKIIVPLQNYYRTKFSGDTKSPEFIAYGIMTRAANTLMAAFELTLIGYFWEPPILFRNALEGFATAWDILHNTDRFFTWKDDKKFDSTDSISNLKKEIKPVGKLYGMLSNMYAHIKQNNAAPSSLLSGDEAKLQFFGFVGSGKEKIRKGGVYLAIIVAFICLQVTEMSYHQYSAELETIEILPGTNRARTKVSARHRKFVHTATEHFRMVQDDPSIVL